ncbi:peptidoglycan DD-metalloendopeptidase family protein [Bacillus sp. CGMCC 1.16541]|uniref:murein hydrolase activator EnvC family protein n=1 Tax=Bacillus sp. CGMCC 1.16541 TaxID=2185143 RepID=UPI000D72804C|nr:peptidoglycan DD-metalloendopeptidase family protein [Bacillus sp. CGMCC 1.16541]
MKRKWLTVTTAAVIGLSGLFAGAGDTAQASTINSRMSDVQQKRSDVKDNMNENRSEIEQLKAKQQQAEAEIEKLDAQISETNGKIRDREIEIKTTEEEIAQLKKEIEILTERINKRNELLKDRARSLQESGGMIDYMDVLLGAQSFSDFISRVSAVSTIVQADRDLLMQHENDKNDKQEKETQVNDKLDSLKRALAELETLRADLEKQSNEKNELMKQLQSQEQAAHDELVGLEQQDATLAAQEKAIQAELAAWEKQQRELAEQRKREAAAAAAQQRASKPSSNSSNSGGSSSSEPQDSKPPVTSGSFMRPAAGPVTSEYGYRPTFGRMHYGIDIGKRGANVPIVSVADGRVFRSYYSSSYGNVVYVTHNINGQVWTTIYAHLENRAVSEGETVKKGEFLGYMGNTGRSFGAHLHFELHKGTWRGSSSAVNPRSYINF